MNGIQINNDGKVTIEGCSIHVTRWHRVLVFLRLRPRNAIELKGNGDVVVSNCVIHRLDGYTPARMSS